MSGGGPDDATERAVETCRRALPAEHDPGTVVVGFDGYVDRIREVVDDRAGPERHERLATLAELGRQISDSAATGSSLTFEWLQRTVRTGGHTCHLARAFARLGDDPVMVGTYGEPVEDVFREEFTGCELHSLGQPGQTDAVEFDDGKLMLSDLGDTTHADWERIRDGVGRDRLLDRLEGATLLGMGYWAENPQLPSVFRGLAESAWPALEDPPGTVLLDPGDVRKLDPERLRAGLEALRALDDAAGVTVSVNRAETDVFASLPGAAAGSDRDHAAAGERSRSGGDDQVAATERAAAVLDVERLVSHGVERSVLVTGEETVAVRVPREPTPVLTTSSGDHFNVGLALALRHGLDGGPALALGNAVAGHFVRNAEPPDADDIRAFLGSYLDRFDGA